MALTSLLLLLLLLQQVLRKLGVRTPTSPQDSQDHTPSFPKLPSSSLPKTIKEEDVESSSHPEQRRADHRHNHGRTHVAENGHNGSAFTRPAAVAECAELRGQDSRDFEQLVQELAQAKLECAEAMAEVEQRRMEARQRETQTDRELSTARGYISVLEKRVRQLTCPVEHDVISTDHVWAVVTSYIYLYTAVCTLHQ